MEICVETLLYFGPTNFRLLINLKTTDESSDKIFTKLIVSDVEEYTST